MKLQKINMILNSYTILLLALMFNIKILNMSKEDKLY